MKKNLFEPLTLPNGTSIPNRIAKAAMAESLASWGQVPDQRLAKLYSTFAEGGAGLLITGNVMVDPHAMSTPGDICLTKDSSLASFKAWSNAAKSKGSQVWMQINHPGRQALSILGQQGWGPSEVALDFGKNSKFFVTPKAMDEPHILKTIQQFANTAAKAEEAGFSGVQIHAAHGYLISQFLSPKTNTRKDKWGGSIKNRARLLIEIFKAIKATVSETFSISIKLNSADFQRGGFDQEDAIEVIKLLNNYPVDLIELSGGNYESPALAGETQDGSTLAREAYFLDFASEISKIANMPLMTTGGIKRRAIAESVLDKNVSVVGIATAIAMNPTLPNLWKKGVQIDGTKPEVSFKNKQLANMTRMAMIQHQHSIISKGHTPKQHFNSLVTLIRDQLRTRKLAKRYKKWIKII